MTEFDSFAKVKYLPLTYLKVLTARGQSTAVSFTGAGINDMTMAGYYSGSTDKDFEVEIDGTGTPDTFKWSNDGGSTYEATGVSITGAAQTLEDGITVTFGATTGHTSGNKWTFASTFSEWITFETLTKGSTFSFSPIVRKNDTGGSRVVAYKLDISAIIMQNNWTDTRNLEWALATNNPLDIEMILRRENYAASDHKITVTFDDSIDVFKWNSNYIKNSGDFPTMTLNITGVMSVDLQDISAGLYAIFVDNF